MKGLRSREQIRTMDTHRCGDAGRVNMMPSSGLLTIGFASSAEAWTTMMLQLV